TPVSIDHVEYLGDTIARLAHEKAGILKPGARAAIGLQTDEGRAAIAAEAARLGVTPLVAGRDFDGHLENGRRVRQDENGLLALPLPRLAGPHQIDNAALAIAAARHFDLPLSEADFAAGLRSVEWPARLMPLKGRLSALLSPDQELWLDG